MTWGRALKKALKRYDLPTNFEQWSTLAAYRKFWQQQIGIRAPCPRPATNSIHDKWRELFDNPYNASITSIKKKKTSSDAYSWDK